MRWSVVLFVIALLAAILGFGARGVTTAALAQMVFYGAFTLLLIALVRHVMRA